MKRIMLTALALILALAMAACGSSRYETAAASYAPAAAPAAPAAAYDKGSGFAVRETSAMDMADVEYEEAYEEVAAEADIALPELPMDTGGSADAAMPIVPPVGGIAGPQTTPAQDVRKVIRNANLDLQTQEFDKAVASVEQITASFGGYLESSYVSGRDLYNERGERNANFTARVPSESLDAFLNSFGGGEFNVIGKSTSSEDITESYYDSRARLDSLKLQEERLLGMLERAEELEYLIRLEQELMRVRYEIESLNSSLNRMDSYVNHSTVYISLYEVVRYEPVENVPVTFGERISRAFVNSLTDFADFLQDFAVGLVEALPFLLMWAVIIAAVVFVFKKRLRGKKFRLPGKKRRPGSELPQTPLPETRAEGETPKQEKE